MSLDAIIYDIEIWKAIPPAHDTPRHADIEYCEGWHDHAGMGVSVICAYDYVEDRSRVFCSGNEDEFFDLCNERALLVGFNSIPFDNAVLAEAFKPCRVPEEKCYDILREAWIAAGLGPKFVDPTHTGYGLDDFCRINFGVRKTGNGSVAPILWQSGQIGLVIDYCLNDVRLTKLLFDRVLSRSGLTNPTNGLVMDLRHPSVIAKGIAMKELEDQLEQFRKKYNRADELLRLLVFSGDQLIRELDQRIRREQGSAFLEFHSTIQEAIDAGFGYEED